MIVEIRHGDLKYNCDLSKPLDISIALGQVKCFYAPDVIMEALKSGDFIGAVKSGAPVNFFNVTFNPHGNGTHTEGLGHITSDQESVMDCLNQYHFIARVVSVNLYETSEGDRIISDEELKSKCSEELPEALVIRTMPNSAEKLNMDYSGTNPPYLSTKAMEYIVKKEVKHLLIDLPSVDREDDGGKVVNHRLFWNVQSNKADKSSFMHRTITELIYVPDECEDGLYLININLPSLNLDAAPSKPVLFRLIQQQEGT